jgi:hypothetical protein
MSVALDYVATNLVMRTLMESGATISLYGSPAPVGGFYVGGSVESLVFGLGDPIRFGPVRDFLSKIETDYVGFWLDDETGKTYFDAVDWYASESEALRVAAVRGELAVWDVLNDREIRVQEVQA